MRNWTLFTACFFFFKQKTAYEMRISDWSSDVCSSDLVARGAARLALHGGGGLALALLGRLLVVLALAGFGQHAGLLAGALEAAQGKLERLVFADFDAWHRNLCGFGGPARRRGPARGTRKPPESLRRAAYDSGRHRGRATTGRDLPGPRTEDSRVGKEGGSKCRSRWSPYH